ncbi:MAG: transposase [Chitinispirillaceae bacterium]
MSTKPRVVVSHSYYQIRSEAATGLKLFPTREQAEFFCFQLERLVEDACFTLVEKSLQQDHYHLVVKVSEISVSWFMRTLNSIYAKYLNTHYQRHGTVFPRRFASAILDEEYGLREVSCHVHLNPLRCKKKIPEILDDYGRGVFGSECPAGNFGLFSRTEETLRHLDFLKFNCGSDRYDEIIRRVRRANRFGHRYPDPSYCVIGRGVFTDICLDVHGSRQIRIRKNRKRDPLRFIGFYYQRLKKRDPFREVELSLRGYGDCRSRARELIALLTVFRLEFSGADLARFLGVTRSAVSRMIRRCAGGTRSWSAIRKVLANYR